MDGADEDVEAQGEERLTHLVYEAALDNSLWPELILEVAETMRREGVPRLGDGQGGQGDRTGLAAHFRRAFGLSERIVGLQEREAALSDVLDALSCGIVMLDEGGRPLLVNRAAEGLDAALPKPDGSAAVPMVAAETGASMTLARWVAEANAADAPRTLETEGGHALLMPRSVARRMGFPPKAAAVLLTSDPERSDALRAFAEDNRLTDSEAALVGALRSHRDLRDAAEASGLSYETARTYLKRVFSKTGCTGQADLLHRLAACPAAFLARRDPAAEEALQVRRLHHLPDGRVLEYFTLGPEDGRTILYFDALSGSAMDLTGAPDRYLPVLERLGARMVIPCRPGGFRSTMREVSSLRDYAPDIEHLCDAIGARRVSLLSYSFGSGAALACAHALPDRVERIVLSSPSFPEYRHPDWRELDVFHQLSGVIGRRWPGMLRQIIPFLVRSIMQNVDRYFDRHVKGARCESDRAILSSRITRQRTAALLAERTSITMAGMVEENVLNARPWDFDVGEIGAPTTIYHGRHDNVCPIQGAELLVSRMPEARLVPLEAHGHYHMFTEWSWLVAAALGEPAEAAQEAPFLRA